MNCTWSPTAARSSSHVLINPPGVSLTKKVSFSSAGPDENEYERVSSLPGTWKLTYCPGRNASLSRFGISTVRRMTVDESRSSPVTVASKVTACVFATAEVEAICSTRSLLGVIWQGRQ